MPTWQNFNAFAKELQGWAIDLSGDEELAITKAMARKAAAVAVTQARADLGGDAAFSGRPGQAAGSTGSWAGPERSLANLKIKPGRNNVHWVFPTKKSGGPWKVAQQGRHQGDVNPNAATAGLFFGPSINRATGETFRTKSGRVRQTRTRRAHQWNGYTVGKNTATKAKADMDRQVPEVAAKAILKVTRKRFDVT